MIIYPAGIILALSPSATELYVPAGQLATLTLGNSKVTTYTYDAAFRLNTMVNNSGQQNLDYDYDRHKTIFWGHLNVFL